MRIRISGTVQGVGFRPAVYRTASSLGVSGTVRNDGSDVVIDTDADETFLDELVRNLPPLAVIENTEITRTAYRGGKGFFIADSGEGTGGVGIPTDTAVCANCLKDMETGRRKGYEFTTCTDCGARFTLMTGIPYDRRNTAMSDFRMCQVCASEYDDPANRRFHHQTVCCPDCGPRYRLIGADENVIPGDPLRGFADIVRKGGIGVAKSWGGMHICAVPEMADRLRVWYGRPQKPFALMIRDMDSVSRYAEPDAGETEHLTSVHRPIVLVRKTPSDITEDLSPGLDNIGIFLPYTGMQHMLFRRLGRDALIMTSANLPGEPMILDDLAVLELRADAYLLHDQRITNRADDSVLRVNGPNVSFIRKSRGHIPSYIRTDMDGDVAAIGAQENLTASVSAGGKIWTTQHIGDGGSFGIPEYLDEAVRSLIRMTGCRPAVIAMDLHPGYSNRRIGRALANEFGADVIEIQHHWAHAAALLADNKKDECIAISVDGTGYGADGNAWGGEILRADLSGYERIAHLQNIPLLGSEKALYDLRRLKFAIDSINGTPSQLFSEKDSEVLRKMIPSSVMTSSFGRLLDALAFTLGVCNVRTYDGEPAMKMEPLLSRGRMLNGFGTELNGKEIMTAGLFARIRREDRREDTAYSIIRNVVDVMVMTACDAADSAGIRNIGLTGGVSYNSPIRSMVEEGVRKRGLDLLVHRTVPNGDGGISVGQAAIALKVSR
jgi:hydrogenase maturation protein HypF